MSFLSCTPGLWTTFRAGVTPLPQHFHQISSPSYPNYQLPHHFIFWKSYGTYRATTAWSLLSHSPKHCFHWRLLQHLQIDEPFQRHQLSFGDNIQLYNIHIEIIPFCCEIASLTCWSKLLKIASKNRNNKTRKLLPRLRCRVELACNGLPIHQLLKPKLATTSKWQKQNVRGGRF